MTAECVSVDHRADQSARECPEQKVALLKWIKRPRQLFHEISIYMKLWGMNTLTHFPGTMCLCGGACVCVGVRVCVSMTPAADSSAEPHPRLDRCVLSQYVFMEMALIEYDSCFIWTVVEAAFQFFFLFFFFISRSLSRKAICASLCWSAILSFLCAYSLNILILRAQKDILVWTDGILSVSLQISGVWGSSSSCWSVVSPPSRKLTTARRSLW